MSPPERAFLVEAVSGPSSPARSWTRSRSVYESPIELLVVDG